MHWIHVKFLFTFSFSFFFSFYFHPNYKPRSYANTLLDWLITLCLSWITWDYQTYLKINFELIVWWSDIWSSKWKRYAWLFWIFQRLPAVLILDQKLLQNAGSIVDWTFFFLVRIARKQMGLSLVCNESGGVVNVIQSFSTYFVSE